MKTKKLLAILITAALAVTMSACSTSDSSGEAINKAEGEYAAGEADAADGGVIADDGAVAPGDAKVDEIAAEAADIAGGGESFAVGEPYGGAGTYDGDGTQTNVTAGLLTAGEWKDNSHWSFWKNLYQLNADWETYRKTWSKFFVERVYATVTNGGKPIENAKVVLSDEQGNALWTAKTDNEGKCYLFYSSDNTGAKTVTAAFKDTEKTVNVDANKAAIDLEAGENSAKSLDLMLVFDTTGSMSDELTYLQKELEDVVNTVVTNNANLPARLSVNFYRDDSDEYVVKPFDFTTDIKSAIASLGEQYADGGGDTPEKVNAALDNAINEHDWAEDSTKLLFIILDAPPHSESADAVKQMNILLEQAAEKGIRIIPIVSSGTDKETEYLMRDAALKTGGTYIFLTDDSGIGGSHITPTIGDYKVEKLNELIVRVIGGYLADAASVPEYEDIEVVLPEIPEETEPPVIDYPYGITAMDVITGDVIEHFTYESDEVRAFCGWVDKHDFIELDKDSEIGDNAITESFTLYLDDGTTELVEFTENRAYACYDGLWYEVAEMLIYTDILYD